MIEDTSTRQRRHLKFWIKLDRGHWWPAISIKSLKLSFLRLYRTIQVTIKLQKVQTNHMLIYHATINQRSRTDMLEQTTSRKQGRHNIHPTLSWTYTMTLSQSVQMVALSVWFEGWGWFWLPDWGKLSVRLPSGALLWKWVSGCRFTVREKRKIDFEQNWQCFTTPSKKRKSGWDDIRGGEFLIGPIWLKFTYTMSRSHSAQMFCPGGNWGLLGAGLFWGAVTCLRPATPLLGAITTPVSGSMYV